MGTVIRNAAHKAAVVFAGFAIIGGIVCYGMFLLVSIPEIDTSIIPIYPSILVTVILLITTYALENFSRGWGGFLHLING